MLVRFNENFGGRNNYVNVDENRKNFGLLIFDPNRTPIQMCLSLARKSRETGHPKENDPGPNKNPIHHIDISRTQN